MKFSCICKKKLSLITKSLEKRMNSCSWRKNKKKGERRWCKKKRRSKIPFWKRKNSR